ncbi:unnamed protein product [Schistosoma margrebowiei]|uniref:Uncharacterized protein n=1 Tax=Schistosoma margrebowiei TaxID=48269 RepID=A0A183MP46_9TREM|nr:unnamed protein product [Schistosoma margrebowiei]
MICISRPQYTQGENQRKNNNPITLDGETLEDAESFTYLVSSSIDEQRESESDVKERIGKSREAFLQLNNICNSKQQSANQYQSHNLQYDS